MGDHPRSGDKADRERSLAPSAPPNQVVRDYPDARLAVRALRMGDHPRSGKFARTAVLPRRAILGSLSDMGPSPKPRRSGPPHNPGVRDLIAGKRRWASPPAQQQAEADRGFRGWHERGYLPHRDEPGLIQFVSFHLADSYPTALRSEWEALLQVEDDLERHRELEAYLDQGRGACHLRVLEIGRLVDGAFRFYHGKLYDLRSWVVMPNHVHALFKVGETPLGTILKQFKTYTAREANQQLQRRGSFWAEDGWDTYMRDREHELQTRRYIESNPVNAGLVRNARDWPWSSARFRDETGALRL
jgi:REP element-mobilizing transposase RayT